MSQKLKPLILIATLVLPAIIFIFLRGFGSNKFNIPVYYEQGVPHDFEKCSFESDTFYVAKEWLMPNKPNVVSFYSSEGDKELSELVNIEKRLNATFKDELDVRLLRASSDDTLKAMHCQFATDTLNQFVLIDHKGRIRGYYGKDLDESDRLIVEVKILLENIN